MGEIMKSGIPERVGISCPTCGTRHDLSQITGNQPYVTVNKPFNICDTEVSNLWTNVCMTTIENVICLLLKYDIYWTQNDWYI